MNIIFLDMDGVINSRSTFKKCHEDENFKNKCKENREVPYFIEPKLRDRINELLRDIPDCKIVWTSTWRLGLRGSKVFIEGFYNTCGFEDDSFIGFTPYLNSHRYIEILEWLKAFGDNYNIEKCVIIDDNVNAEIPQNSEKHIKEFVDRFNIKFFLINSNTGITEKIKNEIKVYFLN